MELYNRLVMGLPPRVMVDTPVALDTEFSGQTVERLHIPHGHFELLTIAIDDTVYVINKQEDIAPALRRVEDGIWIMHNALYDLTQLRALVDIPEHYVHDTMIVDQGLWGGWYQTFSLAALARRYLQVHMDKETRESFIEHTGPLTQDQIRYAALDAYFTLRIYEAQTQVNHWPGYRDGTYDKTDGPMIWVALEYAPAKVNAQGWAELAEYFQTQAKMLETQLGINVKSVPQVKQYLADRGIHVDSTAKGILEEYGDATADIILCREMRDASSRWGFSWLEKYLLPGDVVRGNWRINGAETGRMSVSDPPLQQIPIRKLPQFRKLFISKYAEEGGKLVVSDISAQEPRITAHLSHDKNMRQIFADGKDFHLAVAQAMTGDYSLEKKTKGKHPITGAEIIPRDWYKAIGLGLTYGLTAKGLSSRLGVTEKYAEGLLEMFFKNFPGVEAYMNSSRTTGAARGFVMTVTGRRVWLNTYDYQWENNAVNAPVQGSAADMTKLWQVYYCRMAYAAGGVPRLVMPVHDELVLDSPKDEIDIHVDLLRQSLQKAATELIPDVPFVNDVGVGDTWLDAK